MVSVKIQNNSPVIIIFAILCTIVFLLNIATGNALIPFVSLSPRFDFGSPLAYFTLLFYVFGHADFSHLINNMTFILLLGPVIEERYGSKNLMFMMAFTAVISGILNLLFLESGILGASGIVFMFIILISFTNVEKGKIPLTFILILILFIGQEILNSFKADQVSQFGHILGGLIGSLFGFRIRRKDVKT